MKIYVIRLLRTIEILSFIVAWSFIVTELSLTQMGKNSNKGLDQNQIQIGIIFVVIYFLCLLISAKSEENIRLVGETSTGETSTGETSTGETEMGETEMGETVINRDGDRLNSYIKNSLDNNREGNSEKIIDSSDDNFTEDPMNFLRIVFYAMAFIWYIFYIFVIVDQDREDYEKVRVVFLCRVMPVNCTYAFMVYLPLLISLTCMVLLFAICAIIWIPILIFRCFKVNINVLKSIFNPKIIPTDTIKQMTDQSVTTV